MKMMRMMMVFGTVLVLLVLLGVSQAAVTCSPMQLAPCATAITSSTTMPSPTCCTKLKEQRPCLCNYMKDRNLQKFIASPNAKKVAITCGTPFPRCY